MIKVIGWGGEPATGKSTIMKRLMATYPNAPVPMKFQKVKYLEYAFTGPIILGRYDEGEAFGGTDRLPMNVQPDAEVFLVMHKDSSSTLLFEGDRLFNAKFIRFIKNLGVPCHFFAVISREDVIAQRHAERDQQNATWLAGRKTKVKNLIDEFDLQMVFNNSEQDLGIIVEYVQRQILRLQESGHGTR